MNLGAKQVIGVAILGLSCAWPSAAQVLREIDDPHTGDRWLLMRGPGQPGGPGRLVLAASGVELRRSEAASGSPSAFGRPGPAQDLPVIHTGDRLIVEENTPLVQSRLQAVALGPALPGSHLKLRLAIGGAVVEAVALGPGRAAFAPQTRVRP
jgi:hypothetical protein